MSFNSSKVYNKGDKIRVSVTWNEKTTRAGLNSINVTTTLTGYTITVKQGTQVIGTLGNTSSNLSTQLNNLIVLECEAKTNSALTFIISRNIGTVARSIAISYKSV